MTDNSWSKIKENSKMHPSSKQNCERVWLKFHDWLWLIIHDWLWLINPGWLFYAKHSSVLTTNVLQSQQVLQTTLATKNDSTIFNTLSMILVFDEHHILQLLYVISMVSKTKNGRKKIKLLAKTCTTN
jgi:hypothetical protein